MLDALKKKLGIVPAKQEVEMKDSSAGQVDLTTSPEFTELAASFAAQTEQFTTLQTQFAELTEKFTTAETALAAANAALAEVEQARAQVVAEAHAVKMSARKAVVVATIGDVKADAFVAATEMLDDAAFEAVSSALAGSAALEADTTLFKDVGVEAQADTTKVVEESAEMKLLKQKYGAK